MSIVTLKRKTQTKYNNMSVNSQQGFSLSGTRRSQGYVGQTSLSRSVPRTLMRDGVSRGNGGCCGQFINFPIITGEITSLNDPNVVKSSTINTSGLYKENHQYLLNHQTVKPDNNKNNNQQQQYVKNLANKTIQCANSLKATNAEINADACKKCYNYNPYYRKTIQTFTKPVSSYVPMSQGEYLTKLEDKCQKLDPPFVPAHNSRAALPGPPVSY
jgi:hypothetical protein